MEDARMRLAHCDLGGYALLVKKTIVKQLKLREHGDGVTQLKRCCAASDSERGMTLLQSRWRLKPLIMKWWRKELTRNRYSTRNAVY